MHKSCYSVKIIHLTFIFLACQHNEMPSEYHDEELYVLTLNIIFKMKFQTFFRKIHLKNQYEICSSFRSLKIVSLSP